MHMALTTHTGNYITQDKGKTHIEAITPPKLEGRP